MNAESDPEAFGSARQHLVEVNLAGRDITDPEVLGAIGRVPRHHFVDATQAQHAYADRALPIGRGQTISQPYVVAFTAQALSVAPGDLILEVGTGTGYAAAVLAELGATVITVEREPSLASTARSRLEALGYDRITVIEADGSLGSPDQAPFDAITVAAAAPVVPKPLVDQLRIGGRLVAPVGGKRRDQSLVRVCRTLDGTEVEDLLPVAFVPLIGKEGWPESQIPPGQVAR